LDFFLGLVQCTLFQFFSLQTWKNLTIYFLQPLFQGSGRTCNDVDECADNSHYCNTAHSTCNNTVGDFNCDCQIGYETQDGKICVDIDECNFDTVCAGANQEYGLLNILLIYNVSRKKSINFRPLFFYFFTFCSPNEECYNVEGSFYCRCGHGYLINTNDGCDDIDECTEGTHFCGENTNCENLIGSYQCTGTGGDDCNSLCKGRRFLSC